jgi:ABC-type branched-subunit amino acid transport system substrate-binding protein
LLEIAGVDYLRWPMVRRQFLRAAPSGLVASTAPLFWSSLGATKPVFPAALLVPVSGEHAALGRSMERAAMLAQGKSDPKSLAVFDTRGTPEGAAAAARAARHAGARILLGPVLAREVRPVVAVAGADVPVLAFSNDAALRESGAFVLGLTAAQIVSAVMRYAVGRGVRRVAVGGAATAWGSQVRSAAIEAGRAGRMDVIDWPGNGLPDADSMPDALLMSDADTLARTAPLLVDKGVQMLGAFSGFDWGGETLRALDGTWLAAPDPAGFAAFADTFEDRVGGSPGIIAGLAYDAMSIVLQMRQRGGVDRSALLAAASYKGVCGTLHFREDGSAARSLAILEIKSAALHTIAPPDA